MLVRYDWFSPSSSFSDVGGGIAGSDLPLCLIQDRLQQVQRIYYIMASGHRR
jgi:hypothetical protein